MKIAFANPRNTTIPRVDFEVIKAASLGEGYDLSLSIVSAPEMRKLNLTYRDIDEPTDILSFPLSENQGEIYICPEETVKEAKKFDRSFENFFAYLFIHGCAHLKGYDHGDTMDKYEAKLRRQFEI